MHFLSICETAHAMQFLRWMATLVDFAANLPLYFCCGLHCSVSGLTPPSNCQRTKQIDIQPMAQRESPSPDSSIRAAGRQRSRSLGVAPEHGGNLATLGCKRKRKKQRRREDGQECRSKRRPRRTARDCGRLRSESARQLPVRRGWDPTAGVVTRPRDCSCELSSSADSSPAPRRAGSRSQSPGAQETMSANNTEPRGSEEPAQDYWAPDEWDICRHWLKGICSHGRRCQFVHYAANGSAAHVRMQSRRPKPAREHRGPRGRLRFRSPELAQEKAPRREDGNCDRSRSQSQYWSSELAREAPCHEVGNCRASRSRSQSWNAELAQERALHNEEQLRPDGVKDFDSARAKSRPGAEESRRPEVRLGSFAVTLYSRSKYDGGPPWGRESLVLSLRVQKLYQEESKQFCEHSGQHREIRRLLRQHPRFRSFMRQTVAAAEQARDDRLEGACIEIVCNQGRHRSVAFAEEAALVLESCGFDASVAHLSSYSWRNPECRAGTCGECQGA